MKFKEIKSLIELCGKMGVSEFSLGDLKVVFGGQTKDSPLTPTAHQTKEAEVQSQIVEKEALTQIAQEMDEAELSVMQIENPRLFEQLMIERELEDDGSSSTRLTDVEQSIADDHTTAEAGTH